MADGPGANPRMRVTAPGLMFEEKPGKREIPPNSCSIPSIDSDLSGQPTNNALAAGLRRRSSGKKRQNCWHKGSPHGIFQIGTGGIRYALTPGYKLKPLRGIPIGLH